MWVLEKKRYKNGTQVQKLYKSATQTVQKRSNNCTKTIQKQYKNGTLEMFKTTSEASIKEHLTQFRFLETKTSTTFHETSNEVSCTRYLRSQ